jgi:hypothetical protein
MGVHSQKKLRSGKETNVGGKIAVNSDLQDVPLRVSYPTESVDDYATPSPPHPSSYSTAAQQSKGKKGKANDKFQCHEHQSSSSYLMMDSYAGDFDDEEYCPGSQLRLQRYFTMHGYQHHSPGGDYMKYPGSSEDTEDRDRSPHRDHGKADVVLRNRRQQQQQGMHSNKIADKARNIGIRSRETDVVVLPPGMRKPFYMRFSPIYQSVESSAANMYGAMSVLREKPASVGLHREGKDHRDRDREGKKATSAGGLKGFPHAHRSEGVLERRTMKLTFMYKTAARNTKSERHSEHVKMKQKIFSKHVTCRAKTCTSIITCTPKVLDLGECNIGDYRNVVFTIKNESDLPALVLPYMESQSLGLVEKELQIPPRQSKQCKFEYIARNIENDYHKNILLINVFNSHCNLGVQVKAKISDAHQVLRHSLFYKIYTHHNKKQLQVYFNKCLYNMPNLKTFIFWQGHWIKRNSRLLEQVPKAMAQTTF